MLLEPRLGKLIRKLNPYTNGAMRTMLCGADPPTSLPALRVLGQDLVDLGNALMAYAADASQANLDTVNGCEDKIDLNMPISDINLRVDNDYRQDYMTWVFRTQAYAVKRALRISYRYQLPPPATGIYATEHVLIGYAGSNG